MDFPGGCPGKELKRSGDRVLGCFAAAKCLPRGFQGFVYGAFRVVGMVETQDFASLPFINYQSLSQFSIFRLGIVLKYPTACFVFDDQKPFREKVSGLLKAFDYILL